MTIRDDRSSARATLLAAAPPAVAIAIFGVIYGSLAQPLLGTLATVLSSLLIFSGAVQFTLVALVGTGAGAGALFFGAMTLNVRNLLLGAVMRPRVEGGPAKRALLSWFLTDEATGLAIASRGDAAKTLAITGALFYLSWQVGTVLGLAGASVEGLAGVAAAQFPVLFIGLAAAACASRSLAVRAVIAAAVTGAIASQWPDAGGFAAVTAAVLVALPGDPS